MMITSRKSFKIVVRSNRSAILTLRVPHTRSILCNLAIHNIIPNIPTQQEPLVRDNRISRERGPLEEIEEGTGMQSLLTVMDPDFGILGGEGGEKSRSELEFYTTGNLIVEFDFCV
jgi:hypothetical protein